MLALFVGVVPATQCVDTDVGLAASERYVLRLTEEAEQVDWIDLAFGNCSSDMALFAETRQLSIAEACGLVHRTIKVYTFGKTSLGSVAKLLGDYDVPADFDRGDDLLDVWCGFTCDSSCPGHPPAAPPLPPREPRAHAPDGADPTLFGFAAWDDEWLPLAPYGWLVQMWCVAIAVQAVAAVLIYLRHRHFMSAWRRFKCDSGARPSLRSNERSAHNPNDIELHSAAPSETQGARTPARVAPVMADSEQVAQTAETGRKSQLSLPRSHAELSLAFRNVSYETSAGTQLLADLTGCVLPGELVAIMGESGAGKTTCLSVLAGRHGPGRVQGQVFVNVRRASASACSILAAGAHSSHVPPTRLVAQGERREPGSSAGRLFAAHSGYMLQATGALCDELSARENLAYASLMRLPAATALETRFARIEQILLELELAGVADLRVGSVDDPRGGLSGGQRRRLMLAIQLLSLPTCLFADEPTSGLDARAAQEVMWLLTAYARTGRSVVLSVHQPRAESFAGFDRLLLLHRGRVAFCGAPHDGPAFVLACASILRDGRRPSRDEAANPADVLLDLLVETDGSGVSVGDFAVAVAHACDLHAASVSEAEQVQARTTRLNAHGGGSCCAAARASVQATLTRLWALESRLLRRKSYTSYGILSLQVLLASANPLARLCGSCRCLPPPSLWMCRFSSRSSPPSLAPSTSTPRRATLSPASSTSSSTRPRRSCRRRWPSSSTRG